MKQIIYINKQLNLPKVGKIPLYVFIVMFVFILAILQDYIYSMLQGTGFYISESFLYNTFWIFFIPFTLLINYIITFINPQNKWNRLPFHLGIGLIISFLHILVFTILFITVSNLVFSPSHRFSSIFNTVLSNQFYIALLWYTIFPTIYNLKRKPTNSTTQYEEKIKLKIGSKIVTIPTASIWLISTDKPYSAIYTNGQKYLQDKSLKDYENELDPKLFLRVHRSSIINQTAVEELKSRSNGDYDALLNNGESVRLSRHYRNNWQQLLQ